MSINITHYRNRTCEYDLTITDANGNTVVLYSGDKIRLKIWRQQDGKLMLDLVSGTPTDNGSSVTAANPTRFKAAQDDVDWTPGIYDLEVLITDASDSDRVRHADSGLFTLNKTPGGEIGP